MTGQTTSRPPTRAGLSAYLEEEILSGRSAAGEKLPSEREMAEQYGVSRPVVREAMRGLVERHLVEVVPGRGAYVRAALATDAAPGMDAVLRRHQATPRDLVEARTMLECTAAALAAARAEPADLGAMADALDRFDRAGDVVGQARYDLAFHLAIVGAAHNPVVATMFGAITAAATEMMLRSLGDPRVASISLPHHRAIWDAIREGDPERARSEMGEHLAVASHTYGADYDRSLESVARREVARLFDPEVTLERLLATVPAGGDDG